MEIASARGRRSPTGSARPWRASRRRTPRSGCTFTMLFIRGWRFPTRPTGRRPGASSARSPRCSVATSAVAPPGQCGVTHRPGLGEDPQTAAWRITEKEQRMHSTLRHVLASTAVLATVLLALDAPTRAATSAQECAARKLKAAGKEVGAKMVCYAKAKKAATAVDSTCLMNAQTGADATINTADGACPGTASGIDAAVDNCVSAFLTDDPGNGDCPARSARAIGK